ncbi:MAG: peptidase U32 family protein, partial [Niameybacter sp.]
MKKKRVELLAPAGSLETLKIAVLYGADAVYIGGGSYGLRAKAKNFTPEEMCEGVKYAHEHGVQVYVTANIFAHNEDFEGMKEYFVELEAMGIDAIIVADPGVFATAKAAVPNMEIHISTQANNTNYHTAQFWAAQGAQRIVLARELSFPEVKSIHDHLPESIELEAFVHGAMCMAYSGRCLLSNYMTNRDANHGECAQPCRLQYQLVDADGENLLSAQEGQYLLSPKDMNTIDLIPQLIEAGVLSFKIEGRMKRPEYVAIVVEAYRRAIDAYYQHQTMVTADDKRNLAQVFNRDFTQAYLLERPGKTMISDKRPNNRG